MYRELDLSDVRFFVLDEADEMLNMGFQEDVEQVLESVPSSRQTMMFSATMPQWVRKLARKYASKHIMVDLVGEHDTGAPPRPADETLMTWLPEHTCCRGFMSASESAEGDVL